MQWEDVPARLDDWLLTTAAPSHDVRRAASSVLTSTDVGYYCCPVTEKIALYAADASVADKARCKAAAIRAVGRDSVQPLFLSYQDLAAPDSSWVKVAYSPTLRSIGETLNFFPGQYPGGIPNHPSPVAAMLTSGLLGAGLGYAGGKLGERLLPAGYGRKLPRTGAMLGGMLGAAPGLIWGTTNHLNDKPFNDNSLLAGSPDSEPENYAGFADGMNMIPLDEYDQSPPSALKRLAAQIHASGLAKRSVDEALAEIPLGKMYCEAVKVASATFGTPDRREPSPIDVNINHLGQTLWETGASPALAASTMSAMYAAQQLPDPRSRPGWVTGGQLGQLAANAAGDYMKGMLVGVAINTAIGTPWSPPAFGAANATLGVLGAVVPKLFGG